MDSRWLKGHKDRNSRKSRIEGHAQAFEDLIEILEREFVDEGCRDYDSPGWIHKQIAVNERNHTLRDIIKLITLKD